MRAASLASSSASGSYEDRKQLAEVTKVTKEFAITAMLLIIAILGTGSCTSYTDAWQILES